MIYSVEYEDGSVSTPSNKSFASNGPSWYKRVAYARGAPKILQDTSIVYPNATLEHVIALQTLQGSKTASATVDHRQIIDFQLKLPAGLPNGHCDEVDTGSYARLKVNGNTVVELRCTGEFQDTLGTVQVPDNAEVVVQVNHTSEHGGIYSSEFWYWDGIIDEDTTIEIDTVPATVTIYQNVDAEGKLTELIDPNGFLSQVRYDELDRVSTVVLPGNMKRDSISIEVPMPPIVAKPLFDGQGGQNTVLTACESDTALVLGDLEKEFVLSFENLDLSEICAWQSGTSSNSTIDSAILTIRARTLEDYELSILRVRAIDEMESTCSGGYVSHSPELEADPRITGSNF